MGGRRIWGIGREGGDNDYNGWVAIGVEKEVALG